MTISYIFLLLIVPNRNNFEPDSCLIGYVRRFLLLIVPNRNNFEPDSCLIGYVRRCPLGKKTRLRTADPPEDDDPKLECGPDPWNFAAQIDFEGDDDGYPM
ncbi:hypothetical protein CDAR_175741 [Caerostris darwini]|uniref:Uncharacterized protein n=1 Tax=Caerostris darwini TaxID=1538125 RepID=A0AAV4U373_9ARAC|nr:hypothetical protein CDAR_175741 [Caerostris darwini]